MPAEKGARAVCKAPLELGHEEAWLHTHRTKKAFSQGPASTRECFAQLVQAEQAKHGLALLPDRARDDDIAIRSILPNIDVASGLKHEHLEEAEGSCLALAVAQDTL